MAESMSIDGAKESFRMNTGFLIRTVEDLSDEEWFKRPGEHLNHMAWIMGHVIWARGAMVSRLGGEFTEPWLTKFARGVKLSQDSDYPAPEKLLTGLRDVSTALSAALANATPEQLESPVQGIPSADGKVSGLANFLALHDTYHLGQASYLRSWLGKKSLMG